MSRSTSSRSTSSRTQAEQEIVDSIYYETKVKLLCTQLGREPTKAEVEKFKPRGGAFASHIAAVEMVRRRMAEFGPDATELVALYGVRTRQGDYDPLASLSILSFEWVRRELEVPDGAWGYALWAYKLEPGSRKASADYWLIRWKDGEGHPDSVEGDRMIAQSKRMLAVLRGEESDEKAAEEMEF